MDWVPAYGLLRWRGPGCLADSWWLTRRNVSIESKGIGWSSVWQSWAIPLALLLLTVYTLCELSVVKMNNDGRSEKGKGGSPMPLRLFHTRQKHHEITI